MQIPVVSLLAFMEGLRRLGVDVGSPEAFNIPQSPRANDATVAADRWTAVTEAAMAISADPALPLAAGQAVPFGGMGVVDYLSASSVDVRSGLISLTEHLAALASGFYLEMIDEPDGHVWLYFKPVGPPDRSRELIMALEFALGVVSHRFQALTQPSIQYECVALTRRTPEARFEALLGVKPQWAAESVGLRLSADALAMPLTTADGRLHETLRKVAEELDLGDRRPALEIAVRARLRDQLRQGRVDGASVARALGISERTMRRRLAELGTTFRDVLESFRAAESERMLLAGNRSLAEIAQLLGYNDQSAWTKAFRRAHGQTPAVWVKNSG